MTTEQWKNRKGKVTYLRLRKFIITTMAGGVLVVLPITVFLVIIRLVLNFITGLLWPIRALLDPASTGVAWFVNFLAMVIVILLFFLIGLFVSTRAGKEFFQYFENAFLMQLPFYGAIKDTVQQLFGTKKVPFSQVVSVDVFGNATRMIGFISDELPGDNYSVFVPTGPNPTNGFIFCVSRNQLEFLDAKPDVAMRMIIGVGTGAAALFTNAKNPLPQSPSPGEFS